MLRHAQDTFLALSRQKLIKKKWNKSGDIKVDLDSKHALLMISQNPRCENLDQLVLHELIHLKLWGMDQINEDLLDSLYGSRDTKKKEFAYGQYMTILEATVQDLTKAFLTANKSKKPISLNRLKD